MRVTLAAALLCAACSDNGRGLAPTTCGQEGVCGAGQVCISSHCFDTCGADRECRAGTECIDGACLAPAPIIESVDGSGSVDTTTDHLAHHLRDRIVITGRNFTGADVFLRPAAGGHALLTCDDRTDTRLA